MTMMMTVLPLILFFLAPVESFVVVVSTTPRWPQEVVGTTKSILDSNRCCTTTIRKRTNACHHALFLGKNNNNNNDSAKDNKLTHELAQLNAVGPASKYNTLVEFVRVWSHQFEAGGTLARRVTTPVKVDIHDDLPDDGVDSCVHVRLLFQKVAAPTGYQDKDEEEEEDYGEKAKKSDKDEIKQGGVEILVEKLPRDSLRVRVRRCEMDDETVVKEMSEAAIVQELKEALHVWRQEQSVA